MKLGEERNQNGLEKSPWMVENLNWDLGVHSFTYSFIHQTVTLCAPLRVRRWEWLVSKQYPSLRSLPPKRRPDSIKVLYGTNGGSSHRLDFSLPVFHTVIYFYLSCCFPNNHSVGSHSLKDYHVSDTTKNFTCIISMNP